MSDQNKANNSLAETGPMTTTTQAVDYLLGTMSNFPTETPDDEPEDFAEPLEQDINDDEIQQEVEPESEAQAEDEGEYEEEGQADDEDVTYVLLGDKEVPLDEIEKGYLRQSDYTKKMQELSENRKEAEKHSQEYQQHLASINAEREHLQKMLSQFANQQAVDEPNWVELAENDPLEYTRRKAMHDAKQAEMQAVNAEQQRLGQLKQQENQARFSQYAETQKQIVLERIPEVKADPKYMHQVETYMEGLGYSKDELARMYDARAVIMADKARKYDEMTGKGKPAADKRVKPKGKVLKPGLQKSKSQKVSKQRTDATQRAKRTGSVNDAVSALLS